MQFRHIHVRSFKKSQEFARQNLILWQMFLVCQGLWNDQFHQPDLIVTPEKFQF